MGRSPLVTTYCDLHSIINFGISTCAGHSSRHWWQFTHRSANFLSSSPFNSLGSRLPVKIARIKFAFARGEASSRGP